MGTWVGLGSALGSFMFFCAMVQRFFPRQLQSYLAAQADQLFSYFNPYVRLTIREHDGRQMARNDAYANVESYLATSPAMLRRAHRLTAHSGPKSKKLQITMGDGEKVVDELDGGAKVWWLSSKERRSSSLQPMRWGVVEEETRYYRLTFHRRHREFVCESYLPRVIEEGRAATVKNRRRRLFTNNPSDKWHGNRQYSAWSHMVFKHPSTFDTLAMDPVKKQEIVDDLTQFQDDEEYYAEIGKAWKRGYLLYGPPGTGKSSMIAAMANFLDYDVYDLELTAVKNNTELRKLFIDTKDKSIIVIEDIDCSLDLTGKRNYKEKKMDDKANTNAPPGTNDKEESNKVTLSGILNCIDGLWSACGGERIIVFTTNHAEKLDSALTRRGRMDMHIEMSYCRFEAFKVLAKNYLRIDDHHRFDEVRQLLEEVKMTPADVAENLMRRSAGRGVDACLGRLVEELKKAKEKATKAVALAADAADAAAGRCKDGVVESGYMC